MSHPVITTYTDLIQHAVDFLGGNQAAAGQSQIRRAIQDAYRELTEMRRWNYLLRMYRIIVPDVYETGTIAYDHTGGASERLITLSGGTFPTWAGSGAIEIANRVHKVTSRLSSSTLQLDGSYGLNPGEDISAGTSYKLFQNRFSLPTDFISLDMPYGSDRYKLGRFRYQHANDFMSLEQDGEGTGSPSAFTIMDDPDNPSRMALHTWGAPADTLDLNFIYYRRPRQMVLDGYKAEHVAGTVSTAASTTLTGLSTTFSSAMAGSVVRVSDNARTPPTGIDGIYPFAEERFLSTYSSATSFTVSSAFSLTQTGKAYVIADYADIEPSMLTALKRGIEAHLAVLYDKRNKSEQIQLRDKAFAEAAGIDVSRVYKPREVGDGATHGARPPETAPPDDVGA
jgi:hypothetical protein